MPFLAQFQNHFFLGTVMMDKLASRLKERIKHNNFLYPVFYIPIYVRRFLLSLRAQYVEKDYQSFMHAIIYGTVAVYVEGFGGVFEFDARSEILKRIILYREYEKENLNIVDAHLNLDKDVVDIGANVGLFSVYFAKKISHERRVLAIEPTPNASGLLEKNLQNNNVANSVIVFNGVASNAAGIYNLKVIAGKEEYSTLGGNINQTHVHDHLPEEISVPGSTVDKLVDEYGLTPGFIKIDTEGAEYLVLQGSEMTLRACHPVILAEVMDNYLTNFGHSATQVVYFLIQLGYRVVDISTDELPLFPFNGEILAIAE
jgi:FkbM family methyltransferase